MAPNVFEIVNIPDNSDDEISVISATSFPPKGLLPFHPHLRRGPPSPGKKTTTIDDDGEEVIFLYSFPSKARRRVSRGECSNPKSGFVCEICTDEKPDRAKFLVSGCDHFYCSDCMGKYVEAKLQDNITAINCPVPGCEGVLEPQHCLSILPKRVFERWGDALCESVILESEKFYCPFKDCSALLLLYEEEAIGQSECPYCNRMLCALCKVPWHSGIECDEFRKLGSDERSSEDIMLMNLAKSKNWTRCPKCKFYVERSDGCLFMRCRCNYTFCYNCGAALKDHYCSNCKR